MALLFGSSGPLHGEAASPWADPLDRREWLVRPVGQREARAFVAEHHYSGGCSSVAAATHGLYHREGDALLGVAWWLPPPSPKSAASVCADIAKVLSLSRLCCHPIAPHNAASFLVAQSIGLLPERYTHLLSFAEAARGHVGTVYCASNWTYRGQTRPYAVWSRNGQIVSERKGAATLSAAEMEASGAVRLGRFAKHKYSYLRTGQEGQRNPARYPTRQKALLEAA